MDQIEEIRQKTDIVQLISEAVALKKAGRNWKGLCPFHEEKTPSFMVSPERQMFKCFGCGVGGDVFKFVMERERIEFGEALRLLADRAGVQLKEFRSSPDQKIREKLLEINHLAAEFYHYLLTSHNLGRPALKYLLKRGITKNSIKVFKLGFSPDEWSGLLHYLVNKKGYSGGDLETAGLVINNNRGGYDRFRRRIMFPLFDHRGRVVGFSGRVFGTESQEAKYVNTPETLLYHKSEVLYGLETTKEAIKKANKAVLVEGELDMISSYQAGVTNVAAIKGSALTEGHIDLLKRFCDHLVLALDMDQAGDSAARRGIELAETKGLNVRVIRLKFGKDPDECVRRSAALWKDSVKAAVPVYDFYLESAKNRFGTKTPEGKKQISDELAPVLARINNQVIKAYYIKKLAQILEVSEAAVMAEVDKKQSLSVAPAAATMPEKRTRQERLEEYLLAIILALGSAMRPAVTAINLSWFGPGALGQIFRRLRQWLKTNKNWEINRFVKTLPDELVGAVDAAYLTDLKQLNGDEAGLRREADKAMVELGRLAARARLTELTREIKAAAKNKDKARLKTLKAELVETSRLLSYNHD